MSIWAQCIAEPKKIEYNSLPDPYPFGFSAWLNLKKLSLAVCHIHIRLDSTRSHVQWHWAWKQAKSISYDPDIQPNPGMLGMDASFTHLSICYYSIFRHYK